MKIVKTKALLFGKSPIFRFSLFTYYSTSSMFRYKIVFFVLLSFFVLMPKH
jgi:hypothetical protein